MVHGTKRKGKINMKQRQYNWKIACIYTLSALLSVAVLKFVVGL